MTVRVAIRRRPRFQGEVLRLTAESGRGHSVAEAAVGSHL